MNNGNRLGRILDPGLPFFPRLHRMDGRTVVQLPNPRDGWRTIPIDEVDIFTTYSRYVERTYYKIVAEFLADYFSREQPQLEV